MLRFIFRTVALHALFWQARFWGWDNLSYAWGFAAKIKSWLWPEQVQQVCGGLLQTVSILFVYTYFCRLGEQEKRVSSGRGGRCNSEPAPG